MQRVIVVPVIGASELEDQIASGKCAGKPQCVERCFGAIADKFYPFGARHKFGDASGKPRRDIIHGVERRTADRLLLNCRNHVRVSMANHHRSRAKNAIDKFATVRGPERRAFGAQRRKLRGRAV